MVKNYGWNQVEELTRRLAGKVDFKPDIVIGIPKGGVIPARLLAKYLGVGKMHFITVTKVGDARVVNTEIKEDLAGKKVLLVEDLLESGGSLEAARKYLEQKKALVKTATYFFTSKCTVKPDHSLELEDEEVQFPWE